MAGGLQVPHGFPPVTCYTTKTIVSFGEPQRGDVIVFRYPEDEEKDFIKRIVGLPGDAIEVRNKVVYINGRSTDDRAYTQRVDPGTIDGSINPRDNFGPVTVPEESYFVMGDNRDQSLDSRFWGYVAPRKSEARPFASIGRGAATATGSSGCGGIGLAKPSDRNGDVALTKTGPGERARPKEGRSLPRPDRQALRRHIQRFPQAMSWS